MRRVGRKQLDTLLIIGEGECDAAFLNHLKSLYDGRHTGQKVKIKSSDGGCPHHVVYDAIKEKHVHYDRRAVLLDSDIPIETKTRKLIKQKSVLMFQSQPNCLEGMLLAHLGHNVPIDSQECKAVMHELLGGDPTNPLTYAPIFDRASLDATTIAEIQQLIRIISNT